jgi:hypothetical protein
VYRVFVSDWRRQNHLPCNVLYYTDMGGGAVRPARGRQLINGGPRLRASRWAAAQNCLSARLLLTISANNKQYSSPFDNAHAYLTTPPILVQSASNTISQVFFYIFNGCYIVRTTHARSDRSCVLTCAFFWHTISQVLSTQVTGRVIFFKTQYKRTAYKHTYTLTSINSRTL